MHTILSFKFKTNIFNENFLQNHNEGIWIHIFSQEILVKGESQRDIDANHIDKKKSHKYFADMNSLDNIIKMRKELGMVAIHKINTQDW